MPRIDHEDSLTRAAGARQPQQARPSPLARRDRTSISAFLTSATQSKISLPFRLQLDRLATSATLDWPPRRHRALPRCARLAPGRSGRRTRRRSPDKASPGPDDRVRARSASSPFEARLDVSRGDEASAPISLGCSRVRGGQVAASIRIATPIAVSMPSQKCLARAGRWGESAPKAPHPAGPPHFGDYPRSARATPPALTPSARGERANRAGVRRTAPSPHSPASWQIPRDLPFIPSSGTACALALDTRNGARSDDPPNVERTARNRGETTPAQRGSSAADLRAVAP